MIKVLFVCYGNICRSPMAEFLFKYELKKRGISDKFIVSSRGTCRGEVGSEVHPGTRKILDRFNIDYSEKRAILLEKKDYDYDFILVMDDSNMTSVLKIFGGDSEKKVFKLMDFTSTKKDVADPWYTHDFEVTFSDISKGIDGFLSYLTQNNRI